MANKQVRKQLDRISERLDAIEELHPADRHGGAAAGEANGPISQYCSMPEQPLREFEPGISPDRLSAIVSTGRKWVNKTELRYFMFSNGRFGGAVDQQAVVERAFGVWADLGLGLRFTKVEQPSEAELRIGFLHDNGSWSTVGTDALTVGQQERTMNFGWNINVPGPNGVDTAIHEIGHALGFQHEHQNPNSGIVWDDEAVYDFFRRTQTPPWSRAKTDHNILNKIDPTAVDGTVWDRDSIMHYAIAAGLILDPAELRGGLTPAPGLAPKDEEVARRCYPPIIEGDDCEELKPWRSAALELDPGEQLEFCIEPTETRDYDFRTFGWSDTVMVLFEDDDTSESGFRFVEGDDDSGWDRNASFRARLVRGRSYELRLRLYYQSASGSTAVMMW